MVEPDAQGRLPGIAPVSVVDIGSNSIRIVVYEGMNRSPAVLFNEKMLCGLGRGVASTGRMEPESIAKALKALTRFKALSDQARARKMYVLATAAAREASNGSKFIHEAEAILGCQIRVLTGPEEAMFSALGVISGFHNPDGIVGDLGGGSLELINVQGGHYGSGITLPLGGLRLADLSGNSIEKATALARKMLKDETWLSVGEGRAFYAVGGTWRALAKLHMELTNYPLHMMHGYEITTAEAMDLLAHIAETRDVKELAWQTISKNRRTLLPYGAVAMAETLKIMKPSKVVFSVLGVREGFLYSMLEEEERAKDPLLAATEELALLNARSPEHARELVAWTDKVMTAFGVQETEEEARYRQAACFLADVSWRSHPDYRGIHSLNVIAQSSLAGVTHPGRAYIALANYYRYEGLRDDGSTAALLTIATPRLRELAKLLGGLLRVVYPFSAAMPGVVSDLSFEKPANNTDIDLELVVPARLRNFSGERVDGRLQQLAKLTGKRLAFRYL